MHERRFVGASVLVSMALLGSGTAWARPELPVLYDLPAFELTDQHGRRFGSKELEGQVWVANFIFTHCPTRCAGLSLRMEALQGELEKRGARSVQLVSFSVDPENDTPGVLEQYAKKHHASPRWHFLTGNIEDVKSAVVSGFKMPMEREISPEDGRFLDIIHGTRFVLVDRKGRIRGFFEVDPAAFEKLLEGVAALLDE